MREALVLEQFYLECLSQASYLIGDIGTGRAVVVDPARDTEQYVRAASEHGLRIERVIETHFHADFLSGHLELADQTGATISYGEAAGDVSFPVERLAHGQRLELGEVVLEVRATPGHTPESISLLVFADRGDSEPYAVLTGDTLFIGDVGRPDLLASRGVSADDLARALYRSTRSQLLTLPDTTRVYPGHGAGSACGRQLSTETVSTIGEQRDTNYALAPMDEDTFVHIITEGQPVAPPYFAFDAQRNREERQLLDEHALPRALSLDDVLERQAAGAAVLDTRDAAEYAHGHLRGSIEVGLGGRFAEYAGDVLRPDQEIVLVCEPGAELEAKVRLARIGFDRVAGTLSDPVRAFVERPDVVERSSRLSAAELAQRLDAGADVQLVDVRNRGEVAANGSIPGATPMPLARLAGVAGTLDPKRPTVAFCAGGYRSAIAASTLSAFGFADVSDLLGGFEAWQAAGFAVTTDDATDPTHARERSN
jgi:glyoxylase-like metal-dependent hydrolase (beta-lactamase superfamily II)/rhodanese-related sulfurtransferase